MEALEKDCAELQVQQSAQEGGCCGLVILVGLEPATQPPGLPQRLVLPARHALLEAGQDRKSTRLNSSHVAISYAVFCLKKKKKHITSQHLHRHNVSYN